MWQRWDKCVIQPEVNSGDEDGTSLNDKIMVQKPSETLLRCSGLTNDPGQLVSYSELRNTGFLSVFVFVVLK